MLEYIFFSAVAANAYLCRLLVQSSDRKVLRLDLPAAVNANQETTRALFAGTAEIQEGQIVTELQLTALAGTTTTRLYAARPDNQQPTVILV